MSFSESLSRRAGARGVTIGHSQMRDLERHFRLLLRWNPTAQLTSVESEEEILDRHFLESLEALRFIPESAGVLVDVGTGNGFPALPLLVMRANLEGRLLEPATRKRAFLKEVVRETSLAGRVKALPDRVDRPDDLSALGPFDILTMRAVAGVETVLAGAVSGLRPGGQALLFVGKSIIESLQDECPDGMTLVHEAKLPGRSASYIAVVERSG
jgi:16S rRNA (guanine527-N7)-methyltransferase